MTNTKNKTVFDIANANVFAVLHNFYIILALQNVQTNKTKIDSVIDNLKQSLMDHPDGEYIIQSVEYYNLTNG